MRRTKMSVIEIAPVVKTIDVRRSAGDAFRIFPDQSAGWWPMTHTRARDAAGERTIKVTIEPRIGGRVYETLTTGEERDWAEVTAFDPGVLFAMDWRLGRPEAQSTQVSVRFESLGDQSCR